MTVSEVARVGSRKSHGPGVSEGIINGNRSVTRLERAWPQLGQVAGRVIKPVPRVRVNETKTAQGWPF
jgi:hypothetical protein